MYVSAINGTESISTINNKQEEIKKERKQQTNINTNTDGYAPKSQAPTNAELYKSMYGVEEKSYAEQMAEHRAKYELDVNDKEQIDSKESEQTQEEKEYYEQYLKYKNKYE